MGAAAVAARIRAADRAPGATRRRRAGSRFDELGGPLVAVCGLVGGSGASTLAFCLARQAARESQAPVLLTEPDARRAGLAVLAGQLHAARACRGSPSASRTAERPREPFVEIEPGLRLVASAPRRGADAASPSTLSALHRRGPGRARPGRRRLRDELGRRRDRCWTRRRTSSGRVTASRDAVARARLLLASDALPHAGPRARGPRRARRRPAPERERASAAPARRPALRAARARPALRRRRARRPRRPVGLPRPHAHRHRTDPSEAPDDRAASAARQARATSPPARSSARPPRRSWSRVAPPRSRSAGSPTMSGAPCASTSPASSRTPAAALADRAAERQARRGRAALRGGRSATTAACSAARSTSCSRPSSPLNAGLVGVALGAYGDAPGRRHRAASPARVRRALARRRRIHACTPTAARPRRARRRRRGSARCCSSSPRRSRPTSRSEALR